MPYVTPLQDFRFALKELAGLDDILKLPGFGDVTPDLVDAILEENGRFVEQAVAPLNVPGDCLLYTSPSPRDVEESRMPSSA